MNKLSTTLFLILVVFAFVSFGQAPCTRHTEPTGGFSYCPPDGWSPRDPRSGTFKTFHTAEGAAVRANFNLKTEATTVSHETYTVAALRLLMEGNEAKGAGATKLIAWTKFSTNSGLTGSRLAYETLYQGTLLRTLQFVLDLPGKKLIFTGTAREADKASTDPVFEAVAKTIRVER